MNLLITGAWRAAKEHIQELEQMGHKVVFMQHESKDVPCDIEWIEGVICNGLFLHHDISNFRNLKYIQLTSAGFDRVPMDYVNEHKIVIHNAAGVYSIPIAEYVVGAVLKFLKNSRKFYRQQQMHIWEKDRSLMELSGKNVTILGTGNIGSECAKRFQAFGCTVSGISRSGTVKAHFEDVFMVSQMDEAIASADIVVIALPLNNETKQLMNAERISSLKDGCILINVARGEIIDSKALKENLKCGRIFAALDVFDEEPLHGADELWDMENVIITPHNSFVGDGNERRLFLYIVKNLKK